MTQAVIILASVLSGVVLGLLSNWIYDILKQRGIFPERPSLQKLIIIIAAFAPFILLVALPLLTENIPESTPSTRDRGAVCDVIPQNEFGEVWQAQVDRIGCAVGAARRIDVAEQPFERGHMFWRSDTYDIYVTYDEEGIWERFPDAWPNRPTPIPPVNIPGPNLASPEKGFGLVWYHQLGGPNSKIGFATYKEQLFQDWIWEFEHGFMLQDSGRAIYVFFADKTLTVEIP